MELLETFLSWPYEEPLETFLELFSAPTPNKLLGFDACLIIRERGRVVVDQSLR